MDVNRKSYVDAGKKSREGSQEGGRERKRRRVVKRARGRKGTKELGEGGGWAFIL